MKPLWQMLSRAEPVSENDCGRLDMKRFVNRTREALLLFFLLSLSASTSFAQNEQQGDEKAPTFLYDLTFEEETLESSLFQILFSQARFTIVGNRDVLVNAEIKARTEEDAIDQLAQQMDWLVTRRGIRYFVYVDGAEEALGERTVNYMFKCRSIKAGDILLILEGRTPSGFRAPRKLGPSDNQGMYNQGMGSDGAENYQGNGAGQYNAANSEVFNQNQTVNDGTGGLEEESYDTGEGGMEGEGTEGTPEYPPSMEEEPDSQRIIPDNRFPDPRESGPSARRNIGRSSNVRQASFTQEEAGPEGMQIAPENLEAVPDVGAANPQDRRRGGDSPLPFKPKRGLDLPLGKVQYDAIPNLNSIMIRGKLADVRAAVEFLQTIDQPVPVVLVELLIVQFVHGDDFTWRYDVFNGQIAKGDAPTASATGSGLPGTINFGERAFGINAEGMGISATDGGGPMAFTAVGNLTASFRQNLKFLISKKQARIVTNPHIAVVSGNEGTIELNEDFNFTTSLVFPTAGTTNVGQPANLRAQTLLTVIPTVISAENIHMSVNTELAAFVPNITNGAVGVVKTLPDKRQSRISTQVTLPEGDTIIIGGLVKEEATDARSKIPGANRLPVVGHLFKARSSTKQFTETVIYITPKTTMPQGYEDEYRKQIFEQMCRLQQRGEDVNSEHRADDQRAFQMRQINDEIDHLDWKDRMRQKMRRVRFWDKNGKATVDCPPDSQPMSPRAEQNSLPEKAPAAQPPAADPDEATEGMPMMVPPSEVPQFEASPAQSPIRQTRFSSGSQRGVSRPVSTTQR